jgi:hypothetical protein
MMEGNLGPPEFTEPLLPEVKFMQDFTSNETYDGLYKFPSFKDPDNDGV